MVDAVNDVPAFDPANLAPESQRGKAGHIPANHDIRPAHWKNKARTAGLSKRVAN